MDPRLLRLYNDELAPARDRRRVRARVPEDRGAARHGGHRGRRSVRRAAARRLRVPRGARPAQARRRVPALHAAAARDRPTRTSWRRRRRCWSRASASTRPIRTSSRGHACRAAARCARRSRAARTRTASSRTAHDVTLWPIELASAQYFTFAPDLPLRSCRSCAARAAACASACAATAAFASISSASTACRSTSAPGRRRVPAPRARARRDQRHARARRRGRRRRRRERGAVARQRERAAGRLRRRRSAAARIAARVLRLSAAAGVFRVAAALLFVEIGDLAERLRRVASDEVELVVLLDRGDAALEAVVDAGSLALFCTPAINLFQKRARPHPGRHRRVGVPRRARPHAADGLRGAQHRLGHGFGTGRVAQQEFLPFYATYHDETPPADGEAHGYYTVRREPRLLSARQKQHGPRSCVHRQEVFLSLVDPRQAPYRDDLRQLSVTALGTNRDLPCCCRSRPPTRRTGVAARIAGAGGTRRRAARPDAAGHAGARRAARLALRQPSVAQLPVARRRRRRSRAPPRCATMLGLVRAARRQRLGAPDRRRARPRGATASCGGCRSRGRSRSAAAWRSSLELDELAFQGSERVPARRACSSASSRVTSRSTASPRYAEDAAARRGDALAAAHRHEGGAVSERRPSARRRSSSPPRSAADRDAALAAAVRALDAAPCEHDFFAVLRQSRRCVPSCRASAPRCGRRRKRCASARIRSSLRAGAAATLRPPARAPRRGSTCASSACSGRTGRCRCTSPSTRASGCAIRGDRDARALPRHLPSPLLALFYRAWAQAQPTVHHDRPGERSLRRLARRELRRSARAVAAPRRGARHARRLFQAGAARRAQPQRRRPGQAAAAVLPGAGAGRAVRRPLDGARARRPQRASASRAAARARGAARRSSACRRRAAASAGPPVQVPHRARPADARAVRRLPARRRAPGRELRDWVRQYVGFELAGTCELTLAGRRRCPSRASAARVPARRGRAWIGRRDDAQRSATGDDLRLRRRHVVPAAPEHWSPP